MVDFKYDEINQSIGTRREAYNLASLEYYLPNFDCSCCSYNYLTDLVRESCNLFKIEKVKVSPQHIAYKKYDAALLLSYLEDYLFTNNLKPTGFTSLILLTCSGCMMCCWP